MTTLERIKQIIDNGINFLITTHFDPDGDAVGSAFAFALVLEGLGKSPVVFMKDTVPYRYDFLPHPHKLVTMIPDNSFDGLFVVDCGNLERVGEDSDRLRSIKPIINIDHHATNELFGDINFIDQEASSTGEIIYRFLIASGLTPTTAIAVNLYTALLTDTGSFRYDNTTAESFAISRELIRAGANPSFIARMVYENHPFERFVLFGKVLSTLKTYNSGHVIMAELTQAMFASTGTSREHSEGFVEEIKQVRDVDVAVLVREINNNKYKISMRSKGARDVAHICSRFGGGGHVNAAGCTIEGTREHVLSVLKEALDIT